MDEKRREPENEQTENQRTSEKRRESKRESEMDEKTAALQRINKPGEPRDSTTQETSTAAFQTRLASLSLPLSLPLSLSLFSLHSFSFFLSCPSPSAVPFLPVQLGGKERREKREESWEGKRGERR